MTIETCKSSGLQTSAGIAISARPCKIMGMTVLQAAAPCTAIIYDNKSAAAGTEIAQVNTATNASTVSHFFNIPVECLNGAYVATTGTAAKFIVYYSLL